MASLELPVWFAVDYRGLVSLPQSHLVVDQGTAEVTQILKNTATLRDRAPEEAAIPVKLERARRISAPTSSCPHS